VIDPPRPVKWFVGLQIASLVIGTLVVAFVSAQITHEWTGALAFHVAFLITLVLALYGFLLWKVWTGKNWARLIMAVWFFGATIYPYLFLGSTPPNLMIKIPFEGLLRVVGDVLAILQAISLVTLFMKPASEWFQPVRPKPSLLFPNG
jgi:hypothetical protein